MNARTDLDDVKPGVEVLLFCIYGQDQVACLMRKRWMPDGNKRRLAWVSTWDGRELPAEFKPYAYASVVAPDPALAEEGY